MAAVNGNETYAFFNVIDGEKRSSDVNEQVTDPRTEEALWDVPIASEKDLDDAVAAARRAFKTWKLTTQDERHKLLRDLAAAIRTNKSFLADIQAKETGKAIGMAALDVEVAAERFDFFSNITVEDETQYEDDKVTIVGVHAPIGVMAAITPWNFPIILSCAKVVMSLKMGNCVIIKPSPYTPYALLKFCEMAQSILPRGVFQALSGGADLGERITLHQGIDHVSFTGTLAVGQRIMRNCAATMKRVILELEGNNASIVLPDADLDVAVPGVAMDCFYHAGQVCVAAKRVYVHESLYDRFLERLVDEVERRFTVDAGDPGNFFSPLSNRQNYERALSFLEDCKTNRLDIVAGGDFDPKDEKEKEKKGFWMDPVIVSRPPDDSKLVQEEQFAPIAPILSWRDEDDVVSRANIANSGLGAAIFTSDPANARRLAARLDSGTVWINHPMIPHAGGFFGGWGLAGIGGELGEKGLMNYCQLQSLHIGK